MNDLGPPISYLVVEEGLPVYDRNGGRIGVVERVVGDMQADIFDGVIVHTHPLPGRHVLADVEQIAELRERGVVLTVEVHALREPDDQSHRPREDVPEHRAESPLQARLRRTWDWIRRAR